MRSADGKHANHAPPAFAGRRVTVVGLGRFGGGLGVTRWLVQQGAEVTVTDRASHEDLADSVAALEGLDVTLHLGRHEKSDFLDADLLVVSPAVPPEMPLFAEARRAGNAWTTEINLFLQRCPCEIVGVTGTVGKSTTTTMIGEILSQRFTTHVGGNIGGSLLERLDEIQPKDKAVLELSSFQLEHTPLIGRSPKVAVVTNLSPNHLDRHGTLDAYADAKKNIFRFQSDGDVLVLNARCELTCNWADEAPGRVAWFDENDERFELTVPGRHNQANAQAAWVAAKQCGIARAEAARALVTFAGLPHRLHFVAERDGVRYYNDSKCTTPEGAIVAAQSFQPGRLVIVVGGYDKGSSFAEFGGVLARRAKAVIALGDTARKIADAVKSARKGDAPAIEVVTDLEAAVQLASRAAEPGDVVLLSPACASYDQFSNYEQRGKRFEQLVRVLSKSR